MNEVIDILTRFSDYLNITNPINSVLRWMGWVIIKGLAWMLDGLEGITNLILGLKLFYQHPEFVEFVESFRPVLIILFALNILYIGYLLIFQNKINREAIITNFIMALMIITLLGAGMQQADRFTDDAINAIGTKKDTTMANEIIKNNITDVALFDSDGWNTTDLEETNHMPTENIQNINITETIDEDFKYASGETISSLGSRVLSNKLTYDDSGGAKTTELDNGWFTAIDQYYYRWSWDFWNMFFTIGIMVFVLLTISIKLAKLFFELAFNYVLANLVAPTDMHSGQKMKQVIQNITSIFVVTILIFLSMKVYMIGTAWIGENFDGLVYLVAMLGFAMAVIDGPNIVERLFGIDAGMKSGWGAIAGTYAMARGAGSIARGVGKGTKTATKATGAAAGKTGSAVGGMAGLASGLSEQQSIASAASSTPNKNGNKQQKNDTSKQSNELNQSDQSNENSTLENNEGYNNEGSAIQTDEEVNSPNKTKTPSLHEEMSAKGNKNGQNNKPYSLHNEMNKKGSHNQRSGIKPTSENSNDLSGNEQSFSGNKSSNEAIQMTNNTSNNEDGYSSFSSPNIGHQIDNSEQKINGTTEETMPKRTQNEMKNNESSSMNAEKDIDDESRHAGQVIKDKTAHKISKSRTVQQTKKSYQIGKNTSKAIKKNFKVIHRK